MKSNYLRDDLKKKKSLYSELADICVSVLYVCVYLLLQPSTVLSLSAFFMFFDLKTRVGVTTGEGR